MSLRLWAAIGAGVFGLFYCAENPTQVVDGGGGSEVVGISAAFTRVGGVPASHAAVRLRSRFFLPDPGPTRVDPLFQADTVTDGDGIFRLDSVPRGEYFLEVSAGDSQSILIPCLLAGDKPDVDLGDFALKATGTVAGVFLPPMGFTGRITVEFYGLDRRVPADSMTGAFRAQGLPEGDYTLRAFHSNPVVDAYEIPGIRLLSNDTADVGTVNLASFENENYALWPHARRITLNTTLSGANVAGNADQFPLLVRLGAGNFDFAQSRGSDIRFSDSRGQRLRYQIERWDSAAGEAEIWVRMDRVNGNSSAQFLTLHWGLPGVPSWSDGRQVFSPEAGFAGVWHLAEEAPDTAGNDVYQDAVGFDPGDDRITSVDRSGKIGYGHHFEGNDYVAVPVAADLLKPTNRVSVSAWVRAKHTAALGGAVLSMGDNYNLRVTDLGRGRFSLYDGSLSRVVETPDPMLLDSAWHHLAASYDGAAMAIYVDGKLMATAKTTGPIRYNLSPRFIMGRHGNQKTGYDFTGDLDEIVVASEVRSADWIRLSYENQKPGSTLLEFGP